MNLSCSSGGDCGFVDVILDPWAINELMAGNDLQVDKDGNIIGIVEDEPVKTAENYAEEESEKEIEKSWLGKVVEFFNGIFRA